MTIALSAQPCPNENSHNALRFVDERLVAGDESVQRDDEATPFGYNLRPLSQPLSAAIFPRGKAIAMLETNPIHNLIKDLSERTDVLRGYL
ncbi:hypothetical protein [Halomonas binhaiensis]|uniref:Uncharacterized protein n=1 Tax=Halomonas binhaiensis TaxID=2562282 RepID=A0A7U3K5N0_9GAMM|nr:hypothetical protein [Halomonas binhaiensis]QRG26819.1 hypothetical protein E4T21_21440 [Halomonas binhaiensis]